MRKRTYLLALPLAALVAACSGKKNEPDRQAVLVTMDSIDARGVQRMQAMKSEVSFKFKGKGYHSVVSRMPDEALPHVVDDRGGTFVDNKIALHLTRGGETVLNKVFTKSDFSSVVDASYLSHAVLEGIVFDKTTSQGIVYAASVCYPQTDSYIPLSITVTADGKMSIQKVDTIEEEYDGEMLP